MIPGILIVLFVVLGQGTEPVDVILLKDGTKRIGVIVEESDEAVVIQISVKNPKGGTAVTGPQTIRKDEIAEIRRMPDETRENEKEKAEARGNRKIDRELRLARIGVEMATIGGQQWLLATGYRFEVQTTCDEVFAKEVCDAVQEAYEGYLGHFKVRRQATVKQKVILLSDRAEYDGYLTRTYGATVGNPAIYRTKENLILAYNCVQRGEAARIRKEVLDEQREMEDLRKEILAHEKKIDEEAKTARADVVAEAAKAKADIRRADPANRPALLRKVDEWVAAEFKRIGEWKAASKKDLGGFRRTADARMEECRRVIGHNALVVRDQNRAMFEMLFHECFHAFARSQLFTDKEIPRWLNEGMASYFEMSVVENGELIHGAPHPAFLKLCRDAGRSRQLPDLASVLRDRGESFLVAHAGEIDRSNRAYAVSWALAHYLSTRMSPDQMDAYVTDVASGADPADALARRLGQPLGRIDEAVRAHVASLK